MSLGEHLRGRRAAEGLTLKQVADAVGVSESYVSKVESGKAPLTRRDSEDTLVRWAQAVNTSVVQVLQLAGRLDDEEARRAERSAQAIEGAILEDRTLSNAQRRWLLEAVRLVRASTRSAPATPRPPDRART